MDRARSTGLALVVIGITLLGVGLSAQPHRRGALIAGALFLLAGVLRAARRGGPGAPAA
jgi:hypothetical protein